MIAEKLNWKWLTLVGLLLAGIIGTAVFVPEDMRDAVLYPLIAAFTAQFGPRRKLPYEGPQAPKTGGVGTKVATGSLVLMLVVGCGGSALQTHARAADGVSQVLNAVTDEAEDLYEERQYQAGRSACGDQAPITDPCQHEARVAVNEVRDRWEPVWTSHEALEHAHEAWRESLQLAAAGDFMDLSRWVRLATETLEAYAAFAATVRQLGVEAPQLPEWVRALSGGES